VNVSCFAADGALRGTASVRHPNVEMGFGDLDVAMDDDGAFVVGWIEGQYVAGLFAYLGRAAVKVRRFHADCTPAGAARTLDARAFPVVLYPFTELDHLKLAMNGRGDVAAMWEVNTRYGNPRFLTRTLSHTGLLS